MRFARSFPFLQRLAQQWQANKVPMQASYLTYSTMLAMVPLIMVVFSVFTTFPIFDEATSELKAFIYGNFSPSAGDTVQEYLELFVANSQKMGLVSTLGLIVVAIMLIRSIDQSLNAMWQDCRKRPLLTSFLLYLGILIFAPLLAGLSIAISSFLMSFELVSDATAMSELGFLKWLPILPFALIWLMFSLVYWLVPTTKVGFKQAASGALVAASFFTLGKQAFIWYITTFPSYQAIYGALAVLPITLLWIQLSWQVVLFGGLFASVLKEQKEEQLAQAS